METFKEIQDWVLSRINDTSTGMREKVKVDINTILTDRYLGTKYTWNLNATLMVITSGASYVGLPSLTAHVGTIFNEDYSSDVLPASKRQVEMHYSTGGIIRYYRRKGQNLLWDPPAGSNQNIYMEWYPQYTSLASDTDVTVCPDKQVIADGALWLMYDRLKDPRLQSQGRLFGDAVQMLVDNDRVENTGPTSFEDSGTYFQEG